MYEIFYCSLNVMLLVSSKILSVQSVEVPKCCPQGDAFQQNDICTKTNDTRVNPYLPNNGLKSKYKPLDCGMEDSYHMDPDGFPETDQYQLLQNSSLLILNPLTIIEPEQFCMDLIVKLGKIRPILCFSDDGLPNDTDENIQAMRIYSIGMILSSPFLIITFLIYTLVRELRTLHGRCLRSQVLALFLSYVFLMYVQLNTASLSPTMCIFVGFSVQYFFLATFFWLNVMCIDIYWAFSSIRSRSGLPGGGDTRKFLLYSLYAWGMPLIILLATVGVDFSDLIPVTSPFKPNVGAKRCFFDTRASAYMYFYGPMAMLLCTNMILFAITAYRIWTSSKEANRALNRTDSRRHSDKQENERFKLYIKLFLVMGINWLAELISFIFGEEVPHYLWYVSDLTNTLQGVFIFIIFVWKRRVRRLVLDRLCMLFGRSPTSRSRGGTSSDVTTSISYNNTAVSQIRLNSVGSIK